MALHFHLLVNENGEPIGDWYPKQNSQYYKWYSKLGNSHIHVSIIYLHGDVINFIKNSSVITVVSFFARILVDSCQISSAQNDQRCEI